MTPVMFQKFAHFYTSVYHHHVKNWSNLSTNATFFFEVLLGSSCVIYFSTNEFSYLTNGHSCSSTHLHLATQPTYSNLHNIKTLSYDITVINRMLLSNTVIAILAGGVSSASFFGMFSSNAGSSRRKYPILTSICIFYYIFLFHLVTLFNIIWMLSHILNIYICWF